MKYRFTLASEKMNGTDLLMVEIFLLLLKISARKCKEHGDSAFMQFKSMECTETLDKVDKWQWCSCVRWGADDAADHTFKARPVSRNVKRLEL